MSTVEIDASARRSWGLPPRLPVGIIVGEDGMTFRITETGQVLPVLPSGYPRPGCVHATAQRGP